MKSSRYFILCCLIALLLLEQGATTPGCPNKSEKWLDLGGDFCYLIETEQETIWTDAVYNCFREGGSLASFHSDEEVARISNLLRNEDVRLYIGLWKHNDGSFEWVDKSAFDYRRWGRREPSDRYAKCVVMNTENGKWYGNYCGPLGYICSSRKDQPPRESNKMCPNSSPKWIDFGRDFCYIVDAENAITWEDASSRCSEEGGTLATFHSIEEVSVLLQHTKNYTDVMHIGLVQITDETFDWMDKSPFDLQYWEYGEPNDIDGHCGGMYLRTGYWHDISCSTNEGYICSTPKVDAETLNLGAPPPSTDLGSREVCGEDVSDSGTIQSPGYGENNYRPNENCTWKITVPENHQIFLHFQAIEVEYSADCRFDYIKVLDGHERDSPVLREMCGSQPPQTILSSGNKMSLKFVSDGFREGAGFIGHFKKVKGCGGNIVAEQGIIQSRNFPEKYWPNDLCTWTIRVPDGEKVLLQFQSFEVERSVGCTYDYIEILDGHDSTSQSLGRFCGADIPSEVVSSGHKITVKFASDFFKEYSGFSAEFNKANITNVPAVAPTAAHEEEVFPLTSCGESIVSERGILTSPNFPDNYPSYAACIWRLTVPDDNQVSLRFKTFALESSGGCDFDYVSVYDGSDYSSPLLGKFCAFDIPDDVISSGNVMTVKFKTDSSVTYAGFSATFTKGYDSHMPAQYDNDEQESLCGGIITSEEGVIQSPNYPDNYSPSERCVWKITVPEGHQVSLKFLSFNVEIHDSCKYDYVQIRDGESSRSRVIARLCGYDIPQGILSSRNKLTVEFSSDSSSEYKGFSAEFKKEAVLPSATYAPESAVCGGHFNSDRGSFSSPNYPESYPPFTECTWTITVSEGDLVMLKFPLFEVEYSENCVFDSVKVFDGQESESSELSTLCGKDNPGSIRSSNNMMVVKFVTDDSFESTGFFANFTKVKICEENIMATEGVIQTKNYPDSYEPNQICTWHITVPGDDSRIILRFLAFEIDYDCREESVKIFEGNNTAGYHFGTFCGETVPGNIKSNGNQMTVQFTSDDIERGRQGFSAEFKLDICGDNITAEGGSISSSNYPRNYEGNSLCTWYITVPESDEVLLRFQSFSLESSDGCEYDSVTIYDGHEADSPVLDKFCGHALPGDIRSSTEKMAVKFKSDSSVQYNGFMATFSKGTCGEDISSEHGVISTPTYPELYGRNKVCVWNIMVPENNQVVLRFQSFHLETSDGCQKDFVEILDGLEPGSPRLAKLCGADLPGEFRSSGEKMSIRFVSDDSIEDRGFSAEFTHEVPPEIQITSFLRELPTVYMKEKSRLSKTQRLPKSKNSAAIKELLRSLRRK